MSIFKTHVRSPWNSGIFIYPKLGREVDALIIKSYFEKKWKIFRVFYLKYNIIFVLNEQALRIVYV